MPESDNNSILIVLSALVIFSYLFEIFARRTRIPSVVLLLLLGIGMRQAADYLHIQTVDLFQVLPALGTIGLILIVFEGALELKYERSKNRVIRRAFFAALIILLVTVYAIAWIIHLLSGADMYSSFANAVPFGIISSAMAIPTAAALRGYKKEFIIYESSFSDIIGIVVFNYITINTAVTAGSFLNLGYEILLVLLISFAINLILIYLLRRITHHVKFFLIISILILVYNIAKQFHLSSLIIILAFGLFLSNADQIPIPFFRKYFLYPKFSMDFTQMHQLSAESSFLLRTFFFALFGFTMNLHELENLDLFEYGVLFLTAIYLVRFLYLRIFSGKDMNPEVYVTPRGLISILLYLSIPQSMKIPEVDNGLLFLVVLATLLVMTFGIVGRSGHAGEKRKLPPAGDPEEM